MISYQRNCLFRLSYCIVHLTSSSLFTHHPNMADVRPPTRIGVSASSIYRVFCQFFCGLLLLLLSLPPQQIRKGQQMISIMHSVQATAKQKILARTHKIISPTTIADIHSAFTAQSGRSESAMGKITIERLRYSRTESV